MADDLAPLDDDSKKYLEDVKKGKPRWFLLICKGNKVVYLKVSRKPIKSVAVTAAKKEGFKGDDYLGIVNGAAMNLVFNLSTTDYKEAPVKDLVLKTFLEDHEFKAKPTFKMVAEQPAVPFDDEDLKNPLIARFMKLEPAIVQVLDRRPEAAAELQQRVAEIRLLLQDEEFDPAGRKIEELVARLKELAQASTPATPAPAATPPQTPTAPRTDEAIREKLTLALERIAPRYEQAVRGQLGDTGQMRTVMAVVQEQLATGKFAEFAKSLEKLTKLVEDALSGVAGKETDVIPEGIVAQRSKFAESCWQSTLRKVHAEVDRLRDAIALENPDEEDPQDLPNQISRAIDDFCDDMNDAILDLNKADEDDRKPVERALDMIRAYRQLVKEDLLIQHLSEASSELGVDVKVEQLLLSAFDELEKNLA